MKPPVPVVLSAVFLGLLALLQLALAVAMFGAGVLFLSKSAPPPPSMPYPPAFLPAFAFGFSLLCAAAAVWSLVTLIGIARLRSWARYSILAIAGVITFFGGILTLSSFAMPFLMKSVPAASSQPSADLSDLHTVFFVTGTIYGLFAAIGIALLVYYNVGSVRALFLQNAPVALTPPNTRTGKPRPTAITAISWIYLVSAPFCLVYLFLPFPAFLFGFILHGVAGRLTYLAFGILTFTIGYGLLRLSEKARVAVFWLFALCPLQLIVLSTPWGLSRFREYMTAISAFNAPQAPNLAASPSFVIFATALGMAAYGVVLWLLHRHREAFVPASPVPPLPPDSVPLAG